MRNNEFGKPLSLLPENCPSTPSIRRSSLGLNLSHVPLNSSPLSASPQSSPVIAAQTRRKSQYKATPFSVASSSRTLRSQSGAARSDEPQMRERFKARCFERASKARESKISMSRAKYASSEASSDGFDVDMDLDADDEDDEEVMQNEFFRRVMESSTRKKMHSYRVSYAFEVGSSIDPDMEDVAKWENDLMQSIPDPEPSISAADSTANQDFLDSLIDDLDEEEVQAYANQYSDEYDFSEIPDESINWNELEQQQQVDVDMSS